MNFFEEETEVIKEDSSERTQIISSDDEDEEEEEELGDLSDSSDSSYSSSDDELSKPRVIKRKKKREIEREDDNDSGGSLLCSSGNSSGHDDDDDEEDEEQTEENFVFKDPLNNKDEFVRAYNTISKQLCSETPINMVSNQENRNHALFKRYTSKVYRNIESSDNGSIPKDVIWFHSMCNVIAGLNKFKSGAQWEELESMKYYYESGIFPRFEAKNVTTKKNVCLRSVHTKSTINQNSMVNFDFDSIVPDEDELLGNTASSWRRKPKISITSLLNKLGIKGYPDLAFKAEAVAYAAYCQQYRPREPELCPTTIVEYNTYVYDDTPEFNDFLRSALFRAMCIMLQSNVGKTSKLTEALETDNLSAKFSGLQHQRHQQQQQQQQQKETVVLSSTHEMPRYNNHQQQQQQKRARYQTEEEREEQEIEEMLRIEHQQQQQQQLKQNQSAWNNSGVCAPGFNMPQEHMHPRQKQNHEQGGGGLDRFSGDSLPVGKLLEDLGINQIVQNDSSVLNSFELQKKIRMETGLQMKEFDAQNNIERLKDPIKGYKKYFESDRPQMKKALKLALMKLNLKYVIPELN